MFGDHETGKNWPKNSKPESSLFRCSNHVTSPSSLFTKCQHISTTHWSTSKNLWMPWTFHGPIQLPFFEGPLHARCILERQTPVRWRWFQEGLGSGSCGWSIFWKNLGKKAYSNCPSFFSHWKIYRLKGTVCCWQNMTKLSYKSDLHEGIRR